MSFPTTPTNGQQSVVNGITYQYASATNSWTRVPGIAGNISASGNVTAANFLTVGIVSATGNITGGNANIGGNLNVTSSLTVSSNGTYGNVVTTPFASVFATGAGANPYAIMQVRSNDGISGMGMQAYANLNGLLYSNTGITFATGATIRDKDFPTGGTTRVIIDSTGLLANGIVSASGNVTGGNLLTGGLISATGNITGGNLLTAGLISATGNVAGNYFIGNGSLLTGISGGGGGGNAISNGTSNVAIPVANGNIQVAVAAVANSVVIGTGSLFVQGPISTPKTINTLALVPNAVNAVMISPLTISASGNIFVPNDSTLTIFTPT